MTTATRFVVVGLGNPGPDYQATRHNAGYMVVDELAADAGVQLSKHRTGALVGEYRRPGSDTSVVLVKTGTFMNVSGAAVLAVLRFYKTTVDHLIVVHDDIDLLFDEIRIKVGGGHGGHNGLRDIIAVLGTPDFTRIRVGVGRPHGRTDTAAHVLQRFTPAEREILPTLISDAADATTMVMTEGVAAAQRVYHTRKP